jgi:hypothetical protein
LLLYLLSMRVLFRWTYRESAIWHTVGLGTPLVLLVFLLVGVLQIGLMGLIAPEPRREWWGRLGGWLLILSLFWLLLFATAIYSPLIVAVLRKYHASVYAVVLWLLNTGVGVIGGKSSKTGAPDSLSAKDVALSVTPYLFIAGMAIAMATLLKAGFGALLPFVAKPESQTAGRIIECAVCVDWSSPVGVLRYVTTTPKPLAPLPTLTDAILAHWGFLSNVLCHPIALCLLTAAVAVVCMFLSWRVDLNSFSMNYFYRNRLVRCYLGASHKFRNPNPFTGFDPHDDIPISCLRSAYNYSGPFPIINTSLNLVKGRNLAWQERKAESFVITPFRCGFDTWLESLDRPKPKGQNNCPDNQCSYQENSAPNTGLPEENEQYAYRPTEFYAYPDTRGLRIGAAVSISGAAASPNMGYHSVPSLALLMTFFNVRLGFWAGNPRRKDTWQDPGPRFGLFRLIAELFGFTDDESRHVYLSDGGHFENLGLYELIKRRCRYILVCDASCDDSYAFEDLGNAVRKCREDIGVEIDIQTTSITPSKAAGSLERFSKSHWAIGTIGYQKLDPHSTPGTLIYIKPSLTGDEPADVLNYQRQHPTFPHQTTADQWFTESQFEGYRRLGQHITESLFEGVVPQNSARKIFQELSRSLLPNEDPS